MEFPSLSCFEKLKGLRSTVGFVWKWDLAKGRICWKILWQKVNFGNDYKIFNIRYFVQKPLVFVLLYTLNELLLGKDMISPNHFLNNLFYL